ncbi:unnamed protein product [Heligmosomoides polygyrus]|uniref:Tyrosine-protein phosphatase domain-containing protein n=1 Tax=Heligmosomoides polygyrus TaxID=6339 RepID=A0A183FDL3_HELPZ|nr:unnamed protein product [Heligmosomoides polygyrus]
MSQIWRRLRVCLSRSQYFYLAALVCQLIEHRREDEYVKAMESDYKRCPRNVVILFRQPKLSHPSAMGMSVG